MNREKLKAAIYRSEKAYAAYIEGKLFFQAARIYKANEIVYKILQEYQLHCNEVERESICDYIFHLEDWMYQFESAKQEIKNPTELFIFERWIGSYPFPKELIDNLKELK